MLKKTFLLFTFMVLTCACEQKPATQNSQANLNSNQLEQKVTEIVKPSLRTWQQIKTSGFITALKLDQENEAALPRSGSTSIYHRQLLTLFAQEHNLTVNWLTVKNLKEMFEQLALFKDDIIPRHLTITEQRRDRSALHDWCCLCRGKCWAYSGFTNAAPGRV